MEPPKPGRTAPGASPDSSNGFEGFDSVGAQGMANVLPGGGEGAQGMANVLPVGGEGAAAAVSRFRFPPPLEAVTEEEEDKEAVAKEVHEEVVKPKSDDADAIIAPTPVPAAAVITEVDAEKAAINAARVPA